MASAERFQGANIIDAEQLSPYWGEHAARYVFALPYVANKRVLDIACGTGYGLGVLQQQAAQVIGVDASLEAARAAQQECGRNSSVLLGDGVHLPFADATFDVITSFETLEHLRARAEFLAELKRVLHPAGHLLLSTPNANYTQPVNGKPNNPFHVFEYTPEELRAELAAHFVLEQFVGQGLPEAFGIPPFYDAQQKLPADVVTQTRLFGWKVLHKMPLKVREGVSRTIWRRPFFPTVNDYVFTSESLLTAPVLVAVCRKPKPV